MFFRPNLSLDPGPKTFACCSRIWRQWLWMPFSGTQGRKFRFRLHNPAMGLVDAWRHGFWAFSGPKKRFLLHAFREIVTLGRCQWIVTFPEKQQSNETYKKKTKAGNVEKLKSGLPHIFKNDFLYFFNTKWKNFITIAHLHFLKILYMEHNAKIFAKLSSAENAELK